MTKEECEIETSKGSNTPCSRYKRVTIKTFLFEVKKMTAFVFENKVIENIKKALYKRGISHNEMAGNMGLSSIQFSARVNKAIPFSIYELYQIAEECLLSVDDLIKGNV